MQVEKNIYYRIITTIIKALHIWNKYIKEVLYSSIVNVFLLFKITPSYNLISSTNHLADLISIYRQSGIYFYVYFVSHK